MKKEIKWRPLPVLQPIGRESELELLRRHNNNLGLRIADLELERDNLRAQLERQRNLTCYRPPKCPGT